MPPMCPPNLPAPTHVIQAKITVSSATPFAASISPNDAASAKYVLSDGHLCFGSFKKKVDVAFTLVNQSGDPSVAYYFYPIAFSDDTINGHKRYVPTDGSHHQFRKISVTGNILSFTYHNDNYGSAGNGYYPHSVYGIYFGNSNGYLAIFDPTIDNGGNNS